MFSALRCSFPQLQMPVHCLFKLVVIVYVLVRVRECLCVLRIAFPHTILRCTNTFIINHFYY